MANYKVEENAFNNAYLRGVSIFEYEDRNKESKRALTLRITTEKLFGRCYSRSIFENGAQSMVYSDAKELLATAGIDIDTADLDVVHRLKQPVDMGGLVLCTITGLPPHYVVINGEVLTLAKSDTPRIQTTLETFVLPKALMESTTKVVEDLVSRTIGNPDAQIPGFDYSPWLGKKGESDDSEVEDDGSI